MDRPVAAVAATDDETPRIVTADDSLWYKDAVIYQLHVKAFYDSNDDGIGLCRTARFGLGSRQG